MTAAKNSRRGERGKEKQRITKAAYHFSKDTGEQTKEKKRVRQSLHQDLHQSSPHPVNPVVDPGELTTKYRRSVHLQPNTVALIGLMLTHHRHTTIFAQGTNRLLYERGK